MSDSYSMAPVWFVDVFGAATMVVLSFAAVWYARRLVKAQPTNAMWTYILWFSAALAVFAVSRSVGHIAKRFLLLLDMPDVWVALRPYSGAFNTLAFVVVAAITLFFQRVDKINAGILQDKRALEDAGQEVMRLNRNLESLVRQRTEELSRSEKKYRRVFEGSMDMIFILDGDARFVDINNAGLTSLGYAAKEELVGVLDFRSFFVHEPDYIGLMNELRTNGFVRDRECRLRSNQGSELFVLLSATARTDGQSGITGYEGIAKDLTARLLMEKQLQRADKLASLGQISTGIAHEINNPLGVMLGYTQLLLRENTEGTQVYEDLKIIEKHARNCKTVVDDLLKFARGTRTNKTSIEVNQCVQEVLSLVSHQFELDKITLETDLDPDLPTLVADGEKLKQVIMNLLMNARQAIQGSGSISVATKADPAEQCLRISIRDTGCGIPDELIDKIFDPFFTTKPVGEGTGLGLSVSYGIIQDHNGLIEAHSEVDSGSTFTVVLPVTMGTPPQSVSTSEGPGPST
ncbi:MAG: PAS domain S-box protein [Desulfomonile tiedjei]|nr:PAS domain S-box protein [Desulfomonile tiedjei]